MTLFVFWSSLYIHFFFISSDGGMKRNLSSSALNLQAMTVAMAATELKIPFHLSIPHSFRAKDHGAGTEGISFLLLLFQHHAGLKFIFHFLNLSMTVEMSGPFHPIVG